MRISWSATCQGFLLVFVLFLLIFVVWVELKTNWRKKWGRLNQKIVYSHCLPLSTRLISRVLLDFCLFNGFHPLDLSISAMWRMGWSLWMFRCSEFLGLTNLISIFLDFPNSIPMTFMKVSGLFWGSVSFFRFESLNSRFRLRFMILGASTLRFLGPERLVRLERIQRYEDSSMTVTKKGMLDCWTGRVFCGSSQIGSLVVWRFKRLPFQMLDKENLEAFF